MALKVVHDGEAPGALRENCCICRAKTNYWYEPKDIALCEHCAKTTKRAALPTKEEWCAKEDAIFKQKNPHWRPMALSDRDCRHGRQIGKCADCALDHMEMAADVEARRVDELTALRKQDTELIRQLVEALEWQERPLCMCWAGCGDCNPENAPNAVAAIAAALKRLEGKP